MQCKYEPELTITAWWPVATQIPESSTTFTVSLALLVLHVTTLN